MPHAGTRAGGQRSSPSHVPARKAPATEGPHHKHCVGVVCWKANTVHSPMHLAQVTHYVETPRGGDSSSTPSTFQFGHHRQPEPTNTQEATFCSRTLCITSTPPAWHTRRSETVWQGVSEAGLPRLLATVPSPMAAAVVARALALRLAIQARQTSQLLSCHAQLSPTVSHDHDPGAGFLMMNPH